MTHMHNLTNEMTQRLQKFAEVLEPNFRGYSGRDLLRRYSQTLRVGNSSHFDSWRSWVKTAPERDGYNIEKRYDGWGHSKPFPAVPFVRVDVGTDQVRAGSLAVMVGKVENGYADFAVVEGSRDKVRLVNDPIECWAPVFVGKLGGSQKLGRDLAHMCERVQQLDTVIRKAHDNGSRPRPISPSDIGGFDTPVIAAMDTLATSVEGSSLTLNDFHTAISNETKLKETETMKNNTKADNFINDQKAIAKEIASLNAGRVSNKVVKEAMRPLVALLFKPTFMQKVAMKLTGAKNPLDEFMNTPYADFLCAQLFKAAIDMRNVDNEHVKKTANSAVIYAGLKVTEELPVEDLIDKAIKQVTDAATNALGNRGE